MTFSTFPIAWHAPLARTPLVRSVCSGPHVLVAEATTLHAFSRESGAESWSVRRNGAINPLVAVDGAA